MRKFEILRLINRQCLMQQLLNKRLEDREHIKLKLVVKLVVVVKNHGSKKGQDEPDKVQFVRHNEKVGELYLVRQLRKIINCMLIGK
jgi:hypothetical protein